LPLIVVATKIDKLSSHRQVEEALQVINEELGLPEGQPLCISSITGQGIKELWKIILEACEGRVEELRSASENGRLDDDIALPLPEEQKELFDDDADIAYSQGYDWVHGTVMYEPEEIDHAGVEEEMTYNDDKEGLEDDGWYGHSYELNDEDMVSPQRLSLKDLRKKARDMEKRGEL
jgi:GTP-binding protein